MIQIATEQLETAEVGSCADELDRSFGVQAESFSSESIGPTFGKTVANSAIYAMIFSLLAIMAYIAFRFEAKFAIPVLIALFHDILITTGVYSLVGREVTTSTVAALLTILGYSLYDTVIVFDRVRENPPRMPRAAFSQIVNRSMSEVLTRSLATSFSTLLPVVGAADLRRRDPEGLRLRAAGRYRIRCLLVDLHRQPGADGVEGARARLRAAPPCASSTSSAAVPAFAMAGDGAVPGGGEPDRRPRGARAAPAGRARAELERKREREQREAGLAPMAADEAGRPRPRGTEAEAERRRARGRRRRATAPGNGRPESPPRGRPRRRRRSQQHRRPRAGASPRRQRRKSRQRQRRRRRGRWSDPAGCGEQSRPRASAGRTGSVARP